MRQYPFKAILDFLAKFRGYATANQVANDVGMSWNTAKKNLEYLAKKGYVVKIGTDRPSYRLKRSNFISLWNELLIEEEMLKTLLRK